MVVNSFYGAVKIFFYGKHTLEGLEPA